VRELAGRGKAGTMRVARGGCQSVVRAVHLSLRCSRFQEQVAFVVIDRTVGGGGKSQRGPFWRGRALWSRRGSLSDAGLLAGSGRFVLVC
jgi:hypothetical protein